MLSASSGGRVLLWTLDSDQGRLVLIDAYALVRQQVPHSSCTGFKVSLTKNKNKNPWTDEKMRLRLLLLHLMNDCPGTIQDHSLLTLHAYKWKVFWWHMTVNAGNLSKWYWKDQNFKIKKYSSKAMSFCLSTQVDCLAPSSGQYLTLLSSILVANTC